MTEYESFQLTERQAEVILELARRGHINVENSITQTGIESQIGYYRDVLRPQLKKFTDCGLFTSVKIGKRTKFFVSEFAKFTAMIVLFNAKNKKITISDLIDFFPLIKKYAACFPKNNINWIFVILCLSLTPRFIKLNQNISVEIVLPVIPTVRLAILHSVSHPIAEETQIMEEIVKKSQQFFFTHVITDLGEEFQPSPIPDEIKDLLMDMTNEVNSSFDFVRERIDNKWGFSARKEKKN